MFAKLRELRLKLRIWLLDKGEEASMVIAILVFLPAILKLLEWLLKKH